MATSKTTKTTQIVTVGKPPRASFLPKMAFPPAKRGGVVGGAQHESEMGDRWLESASRPLARKRPSIFGALEPIQKVKTYG